MTWSSTAERAPGPARAGRDRRAAGGVRAGAQRDKTRIVYCKDADRRGSHEHERVHFLGYTFRPRLAKSKRGKHFVSFSPGGQRRTRKTRSGARSAAGGCTVRSDKTLTDLAQHDQPRGARLDQLLRALLQVRVVSGSSDASTTTSCGGPCGNTSGCAARQTGRAGWLADVARRAARPVRPLAARGCALTAGRWEPDESRGSRPVLREPGGEIPPATHLVIMCRNRRRAEAARDLVIAILARLGLQLHPDKTRIVCLTGGREGFDFLGFHHHKVEVAEVARSLVLAALAVGSGDEIDSDQGPRFDHPPLGRLLRR